MKWQIGCSGFYYKEWKDFFYPKGLAQKDWFKFYCENFNTIEINSSFYKVPSPKSLDKWYNDSVADFSFTMKAPRLITHYKKLEGCKNDFWEFNQIVSEGLKEKLAYILFQFPPSFVFSEERLERLIDLLATVNSQNVVEFRHSSWWTEIVYSKLAENHIIFSGQSHPSNLPESIIKTGSNIYYRFHGKAVLYKSEYELLVLEDFVKAIPADTQQVFVYFNNTWGNGAITNAKQLITLLS
ncbi:DUF72 domain-containing protein [Pedobacter xixiisoli]|uniref:Uncharacterized conserved protein YecE, DUF72 family n=1 Tax=Pedobacter xixiisoli TaxID=1476464 RepID=A0A286AAR6_9SPHI|nr:DUF72 domain-containing protein [Pedobacter xixiisoli]SOD18998.1 Uncharacterized conserved protein YecE, DUF72 family [Pedobacter xixiisoli]